MKVEISQAKKEATDFSLKISQSERQKLKEEAENAKHSSDDVKLPTQRKTEEEYLKSKKRKDGRDDNLDVLRTLFS